MNRRLRMKRESEDEALEAAYWRFDSLKKRKGRPMPERDAFKAAVRELHARWERTLRADEASA